MSSGTSNKSLGEQIKALWTGSLDLHASYPVAVKLAFGAILLVVSTGWYLWAQVGKLAPLEERLNGLEKLIREEVRGAAASLKADFQRQSDETLKNAKADVETFRQASSLYRYLDARRCASDFEPSVSAVKSSPAYGKIRDTDPMLWLSIHGLYLNAVLNSGKFVLVDGSDLKKAEELLASQGKGEPACYPPTLDIGKAYLVIDDFSKARRNFSAVIENSAQDDFYLSSAICNSALVELIDPRRTNPEDRVKAGWESIKTSLNTRYASYDKVNSAMALIPGSPFWKHASRSDVVIFNDAFARFSDHLAKNRWATKTIEVQTENGRKTVEVIYFYEVEKKSPTDSKVSFVSPCCGNPG